MCTSCHAGLSSYGLWQFFHRAEVDSEAPIYCRLCSGFPECEEFLVKLAETLDRGVFSYFFDYIRDRVVEKQNTEADVKRKEDREEPSSEDVGGSEEEHQILPRCPESRVINYSLLWYRLVGMPQDKPAFLVCRRCYTYHVHNTALAAEFEPELHPNHVAAACNFGSLHYKIASGLTPLQPETLILSETIYHIELSLLLVPGFKTAALMAQYGVEWRIMKWMAL
jgi:hypothetical protein